MDQATRHGYDVIYLAACALHKQAPAAARVKAMDLPAVFSMAKFHGMSGITCMALESMPAAEKDDIFAANRDCIRKWQEAKAKGIHKNMLMDAERETLFAWMEEQKIWHMPLKGILLQSLYPEYGMRQMTDNDILFDARFRETVRTYFSNGGYEIIQAEDESHDVYKKQPVYLFEMHFSMFREDPDPLKHAYYRDVYSRLQPKEAGSCEMRFSDEDMYVYCTAHSEGHFSIAGIGLRSLLDTYVYISAKGDTLDWNYIGMECRKQGIDTYEKAARELAERFFGSSWETVGTEVNPVSDDMRELIDFFIHSGTHGTEKHSVLLKLRKSTAGKEKLSVWKRLCYIFRRIWPDMETCRKSFPFFYTHKILMPFLPFYRVVMSLKHRPGKMAREWKWIWKA